MGVKADLENIIQAASDALNLTADIQATKARINEDPNAEVDLTPGQIQVARDTRASRIQTIKTLAAKLP